MVSGCKSTCYMNWSLLPFRLDKLVGISSRKNFFWTFPDILWRLGALFRTRQEVSLSNSNKTCHFLSYAHLRKYSMERKSQNDNVENYRKKLLCFVRLERKSMKFCNNNSPVTWATIFHGSSMAVFWSSIFSLNCGAPLRVSLPSVLASPKSLDKVTLYVPTSSPVTWTESDLRMESCGANVIRS